MASLDMFPDAAIQYLIEKKDEEMAKHEKPYERDSKAQLPDSCGHHCGTQKAGLAPAITRHCDCEECHNGMSEVDNRVMPRNETIDPRGIT